MARIVVQSYENAAPRWYDQLEPSTLSESEFEKKIMLHATSVYPNFHVVPFKKIVNAENPDTGEIETVKPDLAFIAKDYQEWWIVEIEMGGQSLDGHVLPQVKKLAIADYSVDAAEYLALKDPQLKADALGSLIADKYPRVLVIVSRIRNDWLDALRKIDVYVATFALFVGANGEEAFCGRDVSGNFRRSIVELLLAPYGPKPAWN